MTIFLDANTIIYLLEAVDPFFSQVQNILKTLHQQHPSAELAVSRLSLLECMVKPMRDNDADTLLQYQQFFSAPTLQIIELSAAVVAEATSIRAYSNLKTPDALQAASALALPAPTLFLTGDQRFQRLAGKLDIKVIDHQ